MNNWGFLHLFGWSFEAIFLKAWNYPGYFGTYLAINSRWIFEHYGEIFGILSGCGGLTLVAISVYFRFTTEMKKQHVENEKLKREKILTQKLIDDIESSSQNGKS